MAVCSLRAPSLFHRVPIRRLRSEHDFADLGACQSHVETEHRKRATGRQRPRNSRSRQGRSGTWSAPGVYRDQGLTFLLMIVLLDPPPPRFFSQRGFRGRHPGSVAIGGGGDQAQCKNKSRA